MYCSQTDIILSSLYIDSWNVLTNIHSSDITGGIAADLGCYVGKTNCGFPFKMRYFILSNCWRKNSHDCSCTEAVVVYHIFAYLRNTFLARSLLRINYMFGSNAHEISW